MIVRCPECNTKFRLADDKMKASGIRVRCSHCNFVFRAGPPSPGEKFARVLRSKSNEGSRETRVDRISNGQLTKPEAKTKHGEEGRQGESPTPSVDFPTIPPSLPSVPPPPLPENPSSVTDDLFSDLPPSIGIETSKKIPEPSPEIVPAGTGSVKVGWNTKAKEDDNKYLSEKDKQETLENQPTN